MIAPSVPSTLIGRSEQCLDLHTRDEVHLCPCEALAGNSQHALDLGGMGWCFERGIAKEGVDRGEAQVATTHAQFSVLLQVVKKTDDEGCVDCVDASRAGGVCSC